MPDLRHIMKSDVQDCKVQEPAGREWTCQSTVEPRFNDLLFNDIPAITINIRFPGKRYSKMHGAEPQSNDLRFNDIPGLTIFPV